ncbi:hypothetical protein FB561_6842 [Kribbella amoyensis]|uniref:Uncharacterized protein n=1 Tax=Kribbella amoyensis TaxID=996641 RepID=A0A561B8X4_9ACTN|nr:hypothetical protein [Kribbella amoyensis]TWD75404.1 hypothetical protein FB561_6842 [Kribbella amoyensis]
MKPYLLVVPFSALITGLFNAGKVVPWPPAILIGAAWALLMGLIAHWLRRNPRRGRWSEDVLIGVATTALAFAACGGLMAILLLNGAMRSTSLSGEALEQMFLPSIPYYIIVNSLLEMLIIPLVLYVSWRPGRRRILILAAAALYFGMRVWTYVAFAPARLDWADSAHSTQVLTPADRTQAAGDLMLDDPRWALLMVMFVLFLIAAFLRPAHRQAQQGITDRDERTIGATIS